MLSASCFVFAQLSTLLGLPLKCFEFILKVLLIALHVKSEIQGQLFNILTLSTRQLFQGDMRCAVTMLQTAVSFYTKASQVGRQDKTGKETHPWTQHLAWIMKYEEKVELHLTINYWNYC